MVDAGVKREAGVRANTAHAPPAVLCFSLHNVHGYCNYKGWNFNSGNYLFTTDTK